MAPTILIPHSPLRGVFGGDRQTHDCLDQPHHCEAMVTSHPCSEPWAPHLKDANGHPCHKEPGLADPWKLRASPSPAQCLSSG